MNIYVTNENFVFSHIGEATLDPEETRIKGENVYTGPFPRASFNPPPEHGVNEYALLVGDEWEIHTRMAGKYWHKVTFELKVVEDPFHGDLSEYTTVEPPYIRDGDELEFKDGKWVLKMGDKTLEAFREFCLKKIKKECEMNILEKYSRDDQRNIDREALPLIGLGLSGNTLDAKDQELIKTHKVMRDHINACIAKCDHLKLKARNATQEELEELI